jgi:hypothetical protein
LGDNSAPDYVSTALTNFADVMSGVYMLTYRAASAGQTLTVTFTQADNGFGNVNFQAATLEAAGPDFSVTATPANRSIVRGSTTTFTAIVSPLHGFGGPVALSATGLPAGATASFTPAALGAGSGSSTMTITTTSGTPLGTTAIAITGTSGSLVRTANVSLTVTSGVAGTLSGALSTPTGAQNLSTLGTSDWAHYGHTSSTSYNHKSGMTPQISNVTVVGSNPATRYANHLVGFTWNGGTPTASATNSATGLWVSGVNNGFRVTVPADTSTRTLSLYVGVWSAGGRLVAHLSDNSAADYVDTALSNPAASSAGLYTLTYRAASPGQTLTVTFTQNAASSGNVTIQAAALRVTGPDFSVEATPPSQAVVRGASVTFVATLAALNGFAEPVTLSASGLPSGATASFSPATLAGGAGSSTLTINTTASTTLGNFPLTITGTSASLTRASGVTLSVSSGVAGTLSGTASPVMTTQNLTTLGTLDWAHWGHSTASSFTHKSGVTPLISNITTLGPSTATRYANHSIGFTWSGGTPTASASNSTTGLWVSGQNSGFRFSVPADANTRTLRVYVGAWLATGRFTAQLSDGSAADFTSTAISNTSGPIAGLYTLTYRASGPGQTLTITFIQADATIGNVTIQAAALQ